MKNESASLGKPVKSDAQLLFEQLRHLFGSKHQVPAHITVWELQNMIAVFTKEVIVCKTVL